MMVATTGFSARAIQLIGHRPGSSMDLPLLGLVVGPAIVAAAMGVFRVHMMHREDLAASRSNELVLPGVENS